jgi:hypothetical protein
MKTVNTASAGRRKLRVIGTVRLLDDAAVTGLVNLPSALAQLHSYLYMP